MCFTYSRSRERASSSTTALREHPWSMPPSTEPRCPRTKEMIMLFVNIPKDERSGKCRINGKAAEFRITDTTFEFRYEGETRWDPRPILAAIEVSPTLTSYSCGNAGE